MSTSVLEQHIFSRHFFDREGLIVATDDADGGQPVGFAHAGFGSNEAGTALTTETGVTHMVMVREDLWGTDLADQLLKKSELYLRDKGAKVLYAGGINPLSSFYLGLYGGSESPGILLSDPNLRPLVTRNQYRERGRVVILQRDLIRFRPTVNRDQRRIGREVNFETVYAPATKNWWETSVFGGLERINFFLRHKRRDQILASVTFWDIEPLATSWGMRSAGLYNLWVDDESRRHGYGTYLLGESFKELHKRGISMIEAQAMITNTTALEFYKSLGFAPIDHGLVYRRETTSL